MNTYQIHVDTATLATIGGANTSPIVSKIGSNPFQCSVLLGNRHRALHRAALKNAQIPVGFFNVRSPYNSIQIASNTFTIVPGNYTTPSTFLTALSNATSTNGTWAYLSNTNQLSFTSSIGSTTLTVPTGQSYPSLAQLIGFPASQSGSTITAPNSYTINFDTYLNIWIENFGPSSLEPSQITYKVPMNSLTGNVMYWNENSQFCQDLKITDRNARVDRLNVTVTDRFGNIPSNNGLDWSFTLEIESDN